MGRRSGGDPGGRAEVLCLPCSSMSGNRSSSARGRCDLLRSWCDGRTALPAELPEHGALRAGLEPAPCRFGVDNGDVAGPQQMRKVAVVECSRVSGVEPHGADRSATAARGNRATSARDDLREGKPARIRTRTREVGARDASGYTTGLRSRQEEPPAGVEPAPRPYDGRVLPLTLRRLEWRRSESNRHRPRCKRGALPG